MKTALLFALALATCGLVGAPTASACPDPDNPCDIMPYDPLDPPNIFCEFPDPKGGTAEVKAFLVCVLP